MAESEEDEVLRIIRRELTAINGTARLRKTSRTSDARSQHTAILFEFVCRESVIRILSDARFLKLRSAIVDVGRRVLSINSATLTPDVRTQIQDTLARFDVAVVSQNTKSVRSKSVRSKSGRSKSGPKLMAEKLVGRHFAMHTLHTDLILENVHLQDRCT